MQRCWNKWPIFCVEVLFLHQKIVQAVLIDGRNLCRFEFVCKQAFVYYIIGGSKHNSVFRNFI
jgi:hypothetical protein